MVGDRWRALARRTIKIHLVAGVYNTDEKNYRSVSNGRKYVESFSSGLGEERRTPPASSLAIFEAVIYARWLCPTPTGMAVGSVYVEIKGLSSHELIFMSVMTICNEQKTNCAGCSRSKKVRNIYNISILFDIGYSYTIISPVVS